MDGRPEPRVAVIVCTYNGAAFVEEQIASILGQTDVQTWVQVRDDGSTDATTAILRASAAAHPGRMRLVEDRHGSTGAAAGNFYRSILALEPDDFDFVAFADQDDIWMPDKLSRACRRLAASGAAGYSSDLIAFDQATASTWMLRKAPSQKPLDYLFQGASAGCTYVLTSEALSYVRTRLAGADIEELTAGSHDWLIYGLCRAAGMGWTHDQEARILYRQHGANAYGATPGLKGLRQKARLMSSGWYRQQVLTLSKLISPSDDEARVFAAVRRLAPGDRLWLAARVEQFRRSRADQLMLAAALVTGLFR